MAYAAVISLKNTIHRLKNIINIPQTTESEFDEELDSLRYLLKELDAESSRLIDRGLINELDAKIREAVWKVEDVLDKSSLSLNISPSLGHGAKGCPGITLIDEIEMDLFLKEVKKLRGEYNRVLQNPLSEEEEEEEALSGAVPLVNKSSTVGLSDLSQYIINQLLDHRPRWHAFADSSESDQHRFVSVVGMAGIGKTHLASLIYHHPRIVQHFDVRVWVRAGPKRQVRTILVDIVALIERKPRDLFKEYNIYTLIDLIGSSLQGRSYLIVLDDLWTTQVFDYFSELPPDYRKERRFLITTRLHEVAKYVYTTNRVHQMPFLNDEDSWNLLWQNVFAEEYFPPQLEKPGRKIAEKCEGLPLLILAVADILRGLEKTEEYWIKVAENKTTTFTDAYENIYEVLLSSYEYLPQHLKPCFLYMGVFPQSFEIRSSKLINLWTVEDFLEPTLYHLHPYFQMFDKEENPQQKLEKYAIKYMEDLVSKSLAIVCRRSFGRVGKIKISKLHSAYWYLCVKEARKNKFFLVLNKLTDVISIESHRRLSVQNNILLGLKEVYDSMAAATSTTRSLLCTGEHHQYPVRVCFDVMLLIRVLDALAIRFYEFLNEVLKLLQLKYLSLTHNGEVPSSVSKLKQLQCLILRRHHNIIELAQRDSSCLPEEIWDLQELRHLRIMGSNLPNPSKEAYLPKLLTLHVNANSCTKDVFRSIWNLKKLRITIELQPDQGAESIRCFEHIRILDELESLKCVVVNPRLRSQLAVAPPDHLFNLPGSLKKLSLNGLGYSWKYMTAIRRLEVLKLRCSAFQGAEWETLIDGEFYGLKFLLLEDMDLVHWTAQDSCGVEYLLFDRVDKCFRRLEHLIVRHCYKLKKIPLEFGDCKYLKMIEVDDCNPSVVASAHQIKEKNRYSNIQLFINSSWN